MSTCSIEFVFFGPISAFGHRTAVAAWKVAESCNILPIFSQLGRAKLAHRNKDQELLCRVKMSKSLKASEFHLQILKFLLSMKTSSHLDDFQNP